MFRVLLAGVWAVAREDRIEEGVAQRFGTHVLVKEDDAGVEQVEQESPCRGKAVAPLREHPHHQCDGEGRPAHHHQGNRVYEPGEVHGARYSRPKAA